MVCFLEALRLELVVYMPVQSVSQVVAVLALPESSKSLVGDLLLQNSFNLPPGLCEIELHFRAIVLQIPVPEMGFSELPLPFPHVHHDCGHCHSHMYVCMYVFSLKCLLLHERSGSLAAAGRRWW